MHQRRIVPQSRPLNRNLNRTRLLADGHTHPPDFVMHPEATIPTHCAHYAGLLLQLGVQLSLHSLQGEVQDQPKAILAAMGRDIFEC